MAKCLFTVFGVFFLALNAAVWTSACAHTDVITDVARLRREMGKKYSLCKRALLSFGVSGRDVFINQP